MGFSDELEEHIAAQERDQSSQALADASAARALNVAKAEFITRLSEAAEFLRVNGAPELRVADIHWGMRGYYEIRSVTSNRVYSVGGLAVLNGDVIYGYPARAGVRSFRYGLRKDDWIFNTAASDTRMTLELAPAGGWHPNVETGQLCLVSTYDSPSYQDANEWLLQTTAAVLKQLREQ